MSKIGDKLREVGFDPGAYRPWIDQDGKSMATFGAGGSAISAPANLKAKLTKEEWIAADYAVMRGFRPRVPLTSWLLRHKDDGLVFDMMGQVPTFIQHALPLPFTHADVPDFVANIGKHKRVVNAITCNGTTEEVISPGWTRESAFEDFLTHCEIAGRRVGERVEQTLLHGWERGELNVPGLTTLGKPVRFGGIKDVSNALKILKARKFCGPYVAACHWGDVPALTLDNEFPGAFVGLVDTHAVEKGDLIIFQATPDVVRIVVGMDVTLMQWGDGWKVACVVVPQVRTDSKGNAGVAIGKGRENQS